MGNGNSLAPNVRGTYIIVDNMSICDTPHLPLR